MPLVKVFETADADYTDFRVEGDGVQRVCEWITPESGHHNSIGVAELRNIRIANYLFGFTDFLFVIGGSVTIVQDSQCHTLVPGQAILIPKGATVTMEIPDWLRWIYVTDPGNWRDFATAPERIETMSATFRSDRTGPE